MELLSLNRTLWGQKWMGHGKVTSYSSQIHFITWLLSLWICAIPMVSHLQIPTTKSDESLCLSTRMPPTQKRPCMFWRQHQGELPELLTQQVFHQGIDGSSFKHSWFLQAIFLLLHLAPPHSKRTEEKNSKNTALNIRPATWWFQSLLESPSHLNSRRGWGKAVKKEPCLPTLKNLQGDPIIGNSLWLPLEVGPWRLLFSAFALVQFWYNSKKKKKKLDSRSHYLGASILSHKQPFWSQISKTRTTFISYTLP